MAPINATTESASKYRVIAMDQRYADGQSYPPITAQDGWDDYTTDHIALLDHLGIERCHLYGRCIGGSFIYCTDHALTSTIKTPCLLLTGNDEAHPWTISEELSRLIPNCEFIPE